MYATSCICYSVMYIYTHLCINSMYNYIPLILVICILCYIYRRKVTNISFRRTHKPKHSSKSSNVLRHIRKSMAKVTGIHHYWDGEYNNNTLPSLFITPTTPNTLTSSTPTAITSNTHENDSTTTHDSIDTGYDDKGQNSDQLRLIIMNMGDQTVAIEEPRDDDDDDDDNSSDSGIWLDIWSGYQLFSSIICRKFI